MRSRWLHPVRSRGSTALDAPAAGWLELVCDLVYVGALLRLAGTLAEHPTGHGLLLFTTLFVPLWSAWSGLAAFGHRWHVDDLAHRGLVFAQVLAVGGVALSLPGVFDGESAPLAVALGLTRALIALAWARAWRTVEGGRSDSGAVAVGLAASAPVWLGSAWLSGDALAMTWLAAASWDLVWPLGARLRQRSRAAADGRPRLVVLALGAGLLHLLGAVAVPVGGAGMAAAALSLVLFASLWWLVVDDVGGSRLALRRWAGPTRDLALLVLAASILVAAVALGPLLGATLGPSAPPGAVRLLCGALVTGTLAIAGIDAVSERPGSEMPDGVRVVVRLGAAGAFLLIGGVGHTLPVGLLLGLVAFVGLGQVLVDLWMSPLVPEPALELAAPPAAVRSAPPAGTRSASGEVPPRPRFGQVIRRGAPSAARNDLYYHLIEGSWTRLVGAIALAWIGGNLFFAALYLLGDASIAGADGASFADAFFFSVQTMSTIGYGALSPGSPYGDLLVTVEAFFGLVGVALATGLMFAKASRPRSNVLFSEVMVVTTYKGRLTLMFRAGNARGNEVVEARMRLAVLRDAVTPEGLRMREILDLPLVRERTPVFMVSWTVMHVIDEASPLWAVDLDDVVLFVATMTGHDGTYATETHARHVWYPDQVRVGHRFVDVMSPTADGRIAIDYGHFHDTIPEEPAAARGEGVADP